MIDTILGIKHEENRKSCLLMAIKSARYLTGRDIGNGKSKGIKDMELGVLAKDDVAKFLLDNEFFFSGLAMYLIAIDCIGCLFDNTTVLSEKNESGIGRALKSFSSLDKARIEAVKDLRNTLAHNFGLATENMLPHGNPKKYKHKFTLSFSDEAEAIKMPTTEWDGDYSNKEEATSTIIGVAAFCDMMEIIIEINFLGNIFYLLMRYKFHYLVGYQLLMNYFYLVVFSM